MARERWRSVNKTRAFAKVIAAATGSGVPTATSNAPSMPHLRLPLPGRDVLPSLGGCKSSQYLSIEALTFCREHLAAQYRPAGRSCLNQTAQRRHADHAGTMPSMY